MNHPSSGAEAGEEEDDDEEEEDEDEDEDEEEREITFCSSYTPGTCTHLVVRNTHIYQTRQHICVDSLAYFLLPSLSK